MSFGYQKKLGTLYQHEYRKDSFSSCRPLSLSEISYAVA